MEVFKKKAVWLNVVIFSLFAACAEMGEGEAFWGGEEAAVLETGEAAVLETEEAAALETGEEVDFEGRLPDINSALLNPLDIFRLFSTTTVTTVAGGPNSKAFIGLGGIVRDASGNLYVVDNGARKILKVSPSGVIYTFAGSGRSGSSNGQGSSAQFSLLHGIAIDKAGNLYVLDESSSNSRIRKISPSGYVSTFVDINRNPLLFNNSHGIAVDSMNNLYVTTATGIQKITQIGTFLLSPIGMNSQWIDTSSIASPGAITIDKDDKLYVISNYNSIYRVVGKGVMCVLWGGSGAAEPLWGYGIVADTKGNLYVTDVTRHRILKLTPGGFDTIVTPLAGSSRWGFVDGASGTAQFHAPSGITMSGNTLYVTEENNKAIRKIYLGGEDLR
ncbi:MAG: hypothetical protein FWG75_03985 [Cystobacterineae bacterium]|nr:hypothetical protein [Cystobacterineae bacterium]